MTGAGSTTRTADGCHNKCHQHIKTPCDHTMPNKTRRSKQNKQSKNSNMTETESDMATRAALLQTKQSKNSNMTDPGKLQTPTRTRGANKAALADKGTTVTPPAAKNNKATNV